VPYLQSFLFAVIGDSYLVERLFSVIILFLTIPIIIGLWRVCSPERLRHLYWLPLCIWITFPKWQWVYKNSMLDGSLALFTTLAAFLAMRGLVSTQISKQLGHGAAAGLAVTLGFLSKGPVSFFPLVVPVLGALMIQGGSTKTSLRVLAAMCLAILVGGFGLYLNSEAAFALGSYIRGQVIATIVGARPLEESIGGRTTIFITTLKELLPPTALSLLLLLYAHGKGGLNARVETWRVPVFFLAIGLSCIIPIAISPKQHSYYIFPALPFFALAIAAALVAAYDSGIFTAVDAAAKKHYGTARNTLLAISAIALCIGVYNAGGVRRDQDYYHDLATLAAHLPQGAIIGGADEMRTDWLSHALFARFLMVGIDTSKQRLNHSFFITSLANPQVPRLYDEVRGISLRRFKLFKRNS